MEHEVHIPTIQDAKAAFDAGQVTAEVLVLQALDAISKHHFLNAIAELDLEHALKTARERDREQAAGVRRGPLHGIPITVKDLFEVQGFSTRAGTRSQLEALGPSTAVARLQDAGAIVIAKANMHEIALGLTGENEWTGDVENPHDTERQSGGSSSGSAVCVAVGAGLASLGTDADRSVFPLHCAVSRASSRPTAWCRSTALCRFPQRAITRDLSPATSPTRGLLPKC